MSARLLISRVIDSRPIAGTVDRLGGWPVRLPGGNKTRVATRTRSLQMDREPAVSAAFRELVEPGALVIDGGAHWGLYTLTAALAGCRVIAFEPSGANRTRLATNVRLAGVQSQVELRPEALWSQSGYRYFRDYDGSSWGLSMMAGLGAGGDARRRVVPTLALDDLEPAPALVKLDLEGAEGHAIRGATRTLARARPALLVEVHPAQLRKLGGSAAALRAMLVHAGYEVESLAPIRADEAEAVTHWHCRPI
jgi:FkbM family methyltransferase